ncbi:MAG: hypothetical protein JWM76_352 [Pseudonocardiales bacterium]|nr:hypothetical protein [Pseudonocardiales bacterium]
MDSLDHGCESGRLFICYPRQDGDFAALLDQHLLANGLPSYLSRRYFPSGGDWRPAVFHTVRRSVAVVALLQPHLADSARCVEELKEANGLGIPIVGVLRTREQFDSSALPVRLYDVTCLAADMEGVARITKELSGLIVRP